MNVTQQSNAIQFCCNSSEQFITNTTCVLGSCATFIAPIAAGLGIALGTHGGAMGWGFATWIVGTVAGGCSTYALHSYMSERCPHTTNSVQTPLIRHNQTPTQMGGDTSHNRQPVNSNASSALSRELHQAEEN